MTYNTIEINKQFLGGVNVNYDCNSKKLLKPEDKEIKLIIRDKKKDQKPCTKEIVKCSPCLPRELVKNGGFEILAFDQVLSIETGPQPSDIRVDESGIAHENSSMSLIHYQLMKFNLNLSVYFKMWPEPGCFLALSYATNFLRAGVDFRELAFRARVYYNGTAPTDLINIETLYGSDILAGTGFDFHQKVSDVPVPEGNTTLTVEFQIRIRDRAGVTGDDLTVFLLDSVSLRPV